MTLCFDKVFINSGDGKKVLQPNISVNGLNTNESDRNNLLSLTHSFC